MLYSTSSPPLYPHRWQSLRRGVDTILCHYHTHDEVEQVLNACHGDTFSGHLSGMATAQKIIASVTFGLLSLSIALR